MTYKGSCQKYKSIHYNNPNSENINGNIKNKTMFICDNGLAIDEILFNDLIYDCGPNGEDEPLLLSILRNEVDSSCDELNKIPCMKVHSRCYHLRDICTYKLNVYQHLIPCRNGGHLHHC